MPNEILAEYRKMIEARLREQADRHLAITPTMDPKRVLGIQIQQEKEKLEKLVEQSEEKDEPALAEGFRALIDWLPELEQKLRSRR